ncbi:MAG TPA: cupredoxin domain-containing protein [Solirubrobacterales bacterium]
MARKFLALTAIVAVPLIVAACGSDDSTSSTTAASDTTATESTTSASTGGGETVAISETEFQLDPSNPTVKAGTVTLDVSNDGQTVHNLEIDGNGVEEVTDDLSPGDSGQLAVDLKPGTYEIYCTIDSHRDQGMEGVVTVQ